MLFGAVRGKWLRQQFSTAVDLSGNLASFGKGFRLVEYEILAMRARDGEFKEPEIATESHLNPIFSPQPFQSGTPSSHPLKLRTQPIGSPCRMASNSCLNPAR